MRSGSRACIYVSFCSRVFQHNKRLSQILIWALFFSKSHVRWFPKRSVPHSVVLRCRIREWGSVEGRFDVTSRRQIYKWDKFVKFLSMKQVWLPLWMCMLNFISVLFLFAVVLALEIDWHSRADIEVFPYSGQPFGFLKLFVIILSSSCYSPCPCTLRPFKSSERNRNWQNRWLGLPPAFPYHAPQLFRILRQRIFGGEKTWRHLEVEGKSEFMVGHVLPWRLYGRMAVERSFSCSSIGLKGSLWLTGSSM